MSEKISLKRMREEVAYELVMRKNVYPGQVARGKMRKEMAEERQDVMAAIGRFLDWCIEREPELRALKGDGPSPPARSPAPESSR